MRIVECDQRSSEWHQIKVGRITASRIGTLASTNKDGSIPKAGRDLILELLAEQLTGWKAPHFTSAEMQWGIDNEPLARAQYEIHKNVPVVEVGFVHHPTLQWCGCSPDGLVGDDGLVEIKCPTTITFLRHKLTTYKTPDSLPYYAQVQFQMACCERQWCDLAFFDPRLPEPLQLHVTRVERDNDYIQKLEAICASTLAEINTMKKELGVINE